MSNDSISVTPLERVSANLQLRCHRWLRRWLTLIGHCRLEIRYRVPTCPIVSCSWASGILPFCQGTKLNKNPLQFQYKSPL
ncbi:hypothetical protein PDIG_34080 [Penicillium digitatum PHI26]|uniref:Uncharacterized protein n=2 Tax=Penicillium digitatum TaxID=36651 RepID=K9G071_PEND2|nr:hypothetical protein PDIP_53660 [Penicillium digitatum Pd1]EKV12032.1 hypothetical protein PDIP_53660 [Penicillium digitatum Pd1]EKV14247.1 hypothetical protein PDIG_34080 [Penicillium digitatum PHI26]